MKRSESFRRGARIRLHARPDSGQHARVTALTAALAGLLRSDGPWAEAITRHTAAVQAARCLGDLLGQANVLSYLGSGGP